MEFLDIMSKTSLVSIY